MLKKLSLFAVLLLTSCSSTPNEVVNDDPDLVLGTTYIDQQYGFKFDYPIGFNEVAPSYGNLETQLVQVQLSEAYPGTNFADADLTVSTEPSENLEACLNIENTELQQDFDTTNPVSIGNVDFYSSSGTGAAAGNIYESIVYRTLYNEQCYELAETIHTSNIENYDPGTVTELVTQPIWDRLNLITESFTFTSMTDATELQIEDLKVGTGPEAESGDTVEVNYTGTLVDGTVFDASEKHGKTFSFHLGRGEVIEGWDEGVAGMKVGGVRRLTIPSDMAYGDSGIPGVIPGGATLIFEVELISIQ